MHAGRVGEQATDPRAAVLCSAPVAVCNAQHWQRLCHLAGRTPSPLQAPCDLIIISSSHFTQVVMHGHLALHTRCGQTDNVFIFYKAYTVGCEQACTPSRVVRSLCTVLAAAVQCRLDTDSSAELLSGRPVARRAVRPASVSCGAGVLTC